MRWISKTRAGALQFVLFIGALIAILLMAFLLLAHTHNHFEKKTDVLLHLIKKANYGFATSLGEDVPLNGSLDLQDQDIPGISVQVRREFWGIFEKRTIRTAHGNTQYHKTALVGAREIQEFPALYIRDRQRPVILAGNARVTGTAYLPEQGLRMGNIHGHSYNGSRLLFGQRKKSTAVLPQPSPELKAQIERLCTGGFVPEGEVLSRIPKGEVGNSFSSPTLIFRDRVIRLQQTALSGNIVVSASHKIIVESTAQLRDIILLAPEIIIKDQVKGYFQALATKSISVGKGCQLAYPSALVVKKREIPGSGPNGQGNPYGSRVPIIQMDSGTELRGVLMVLENTEESQYTPQIRIAENAMVLGEVYCSKNLELKGRVSGSVTTDSFIALEKGNIYQNHLYNGHINGENLAPAYVGLLMAGREANKKVMKWLY
ncbi:MAG: hypothetical protein AAGA86_11270 [Bacteroidota bacterium]